MVSTLQPALDNGNPDSLARGWRRWVRARDAAYAKPGTQHSEIYFRRLAVAQAYFWTEVSLRAETRSKWDTKIAFYVCSEFCAVMQSQLQMGRIGAVNMLFRDTVDPASLSRAVTCHVCRRKVNRDGSVDSTHRIDFSDPTQVIQGVPRRTKKVNYPRTIAVKKPDTCSTVVFSVTPEEKRALDIFLETYRRVNS